jgi:hypothetical protein
LAKRQQPPLSTTTLLGVWRRFNEGQLQGHFLKKPQPKNILFPIKTKKSVNRLITQVVVERHDSF